MAKREIPLFIYDTDRRHGLGERDFVVCTDRESGFVAQFDLIEGQDELNTDTERVSAPINGISVKMTIKRVTGSNPDKTAIRTLMRKAHTEYINRASNAADINDPTDEQVRNFVRSFIKDARTQFANTRDIKRKQTIAVTIKFFEAIEGRI